MRNNLHPFMILRDKFWYWREQEAEKARRKAGEKDSVLRELELKENTASLKYEQAVSILFIYQRLVFPASLSQQTLCLLQIFDKKFLLTRITRYIDLQFR